MAATNYATALQEELFCPICLDYFTDPVILNCEHNFCRACISTYWESLGDSFPCPQCRKRCRNGKVRPNAQLGKVAERAKELAARDTALPRMPPVAGNKPEPVQEMCKQHLETLKLFCKDDKSLICVVCDKSKEHRNHTVIPVQEAAEEYKAQFQHHLATLKSERDSREILAINNGKKLEMLVDIGSHLNRYKSWSFPKWTPVSTTELEERISHFSHKKTVLWEHMTAMRAPTGPAITAGRTEELKSTFPINISGEMPAMKIDPLPCIMDTNGTYTVTTISKGYEISFAATVIISDKMVLNSGRCGTINLQILLPIFGASITTIQDTTTQGTISEGAFVPNITDLGVSTSPLEDATKNVPPNITNTVSEKTPSIIDTTTVAHKTATALTMDIFDLLQQPFSDQEDVSTREMPETESPIGAITGKTSFSDHEDTTITPTLREPSSDTQENPETCYLDCDGFPAWATVLICLTTTFFLFMLVGLLFLVPYCMKFRHPPAMTYNSSPRYSA
ncbi:uncharacterized protein LOC103278024 isoform X1 [Anolis carolinensis]|uniref:uncharacterized protein LOC103278024 isoform X1 n=1 Tax=Anolis carolinensis TaxID=28377 RepID=UPI002F2B739E